MNSATYARRIFYSALLSLAITFASAQLDNTYLSDHIEMHRVDSGTHLFGSSINAFTYMRNTEYFNNIEVGRTLFGYQLHPSLFYQPHSAVKISAGVFLRNDFGGNNPYTDILPTFTIKTSHTRFRGAHTTNTFSMIAGTLEGALSHRMIEPLFNSSSAIEKRIENGFELKLEKRSNNGYQTQDKGYYDLWINWEKFIERGSPYKEIFTSGLNLQPKWMGDFTLVYPVFQGMLTHHGGQIDSDTSNPMTMQLNMAVGLKADLPITKEQGLTVEGYYLGYRETTSSGVWPFREGTGVYANMTYRVGMSNSVLIPKGLSCMLSYWNATNFIAPRGTPIYQSQSIDDPTYFESKRELLFFRLLYDKRLFEKLCMSARVEPFYDLRNKTLDYSFSFYLTYRQDINFGKK